MNLSVRLRLGAATFAVGTALGVLFWPTDAEAGRSYAKRGEPCTAVGEKRPNRSGVWYICDYRPQVGDECPVWHALHAKPGPWPSRSPYDCPRCSPSPSKPASGSPHTSSSAPTASTSSAPAVTPTRSTSSSGQSAQTLPVTGGSERVAAFLAVLGVALVFFGAAILWIVKPWRRHD